jgi:hypothetical protein
MLTAGFRCAPSFPHEHDDPQHHQPASDDRRGPTDRIRKRRSHHPPTSGDRHQKERTQELREQSAPLLIRILKIRDRLDHVLLQLRGDPARDASISSSDPVRHKSALQTSTIPRCSEPTHASAQRPYHRQSDGKLNESTETGRHPDRVSGPSATPDRLGGEDPTQSNESRIRRGEQRSGRGATVAASARRALMPALVTASVGTCLGCRTGIFAPAPTVSECAGRASLPPAGRDRNAEGLEIRATQVCPRHLRDASRPQEAGAVRHRLRDTKAP